MKKGESLRSNTVRRQSTLSAWQAVLDDFKNEVPVPVIATKHNNPKTQRPYSTNHIYWILRRMGATI